ncbi:winged helix-turn-helix domain-containing protein [Ferrimicrobium sp.]|uniref:ArsR/SmtB family transcription factor n=1 Tax=Ferrimicrobium sp. TaxID=2926050 RepID=UPI00261C8BB8|nr:winged helix-turn-helix domain-containing protein [Ferrimicrobium sp.]
MTTNTAAFGDSDIAIVAALMGEPARAAVLMALLDGRALAASTLAAEAGVSASTISAHLARLVDGGLINVENSGRYRYFRISRSEVAQALEALARLAPSRPIRSLRQDTHAKAIREARTCYDHLAGRLGVALLESLVRDGVLVAHESKLTEEPDPIVGAGRSLDYLLTDEGRSRLLDLGVQLVAPPRRPLTRYCLDWSEQRPHLAGALGNALFLRLADLGWIIRGERRVVKVTPSGRSHLAQEFGIVIGE